MKRSWILLGLGAGLLAINTACLAVTVGSAAGVEDPARSTTKVRKPFKGWVVGLDATPPKDAPTPALNVPYVDPVYNTTITRVTDASQVTDRDIPTWVRHEYSRRPAFNADGSKVVMTSSNGWLRLYTVDTPGNRLAFVKTLKAGGSIEPNWDPTNPNVFYHFGANGSGFQIFKYDIRTDADSIARDLSSRVKAMYPNAGTMWTKEEGRPSKDGKLWCMMIERYDEKAQKVNHFGLVAYDFAADKILGHLDTTERPDHVSASPLGTYCVPSFGAPTGTRAYTTDFSKYTQLHTNSEHSDLGLTKDGKEVYVYSDYSSGPHEGQLVMTMLADGAKTDLVKIYGPSDSSTALHVSGTAMDKPGFFVVDFDHCLEQHNSAPCDPSKQWIYNKVVIIELGAKPKVYNLAHTHFGDAGYWGETQSVANRDLTKVLFASSWGKTQERAISSYVVDVPPLR